ncbi:MAG: hypothetical protein U0132_06030 [Gemmatimonadaceae bacterium]
MSERKPFLLRVDRELLDALQRWANDDLRSLNGQIEFLLRRALREGGRDIPLRSAPSNLPEASADSPDPTEPG